MGTCTALPTRAERVAVAQVFKMSTSGALTTLYSFSNGADGGHVAAGLVQASDGYFYGTTYKGGASGNGTVFRITANGSLTTVLSFNQANGALPLAELVQDAAGVLYGTTSSGGALQLRRGVPHDHSRHAPQPLFVHRRQ